MVTDCWRFASASMDCWRRWTSVCTRPSRRLGLSFSSCTGSASFWAVMRITAAPRSAILTTGARPLTGVPKIAWSSACEAPSAGDRHAATVIAELLDAPTQGRGHGLQVGTGQGGPPPLQLLGARRGGLLPLDAFQRLGLDLLEGAQAGLPDLGDTVQDPAARRPSRPTDEALLGADDLGHQLGVAAEAGDEVGPLEEWRHVGGHDIVGQGLPLLLGGELGGIDLLAQRRGTTAALAIGKAVRQGAADRLPHLVQGPLPCRLALLDLDDVVPELAPHRRRDAARWSAKAA